MIFLRGLRGGCALRRSFSGLAGLLGPSPLSAARSAAVRHPYKQLGLRRLRRLSAAEIQSNLIKMP
ncbi:hypothetical protein SapgrDRAFT_1651 [Saprospira grandis DSM 2844]|uniref:Uncharacterized protein n=1 Tax=Saprospira grandis DSM 2844 TaxID=694433 RepID=J0P772_9BACT|nr:hypothetical protein SapgrDRAFT_1651 [Saprospira grandis DSM 2844]